MTRRTSFSSLFVSAAVTASVACGGAAEVGAPAAKSPEARSEEPSTIEDAQAQISAAQAQLAGGNRFAPPARAAPPASDSASAPPMPEAPKKSTTAPAASDEPRPGATSGDRCGSPCRALASMRRAVGALCRMTGSDDTRCLDAKHTLADSEGRVAPCSC